MTDSSNVQSVLPLDRTQLVVDIVSAYVSNNAVQPADLPGLIRSVAASLSAAAAGPVIEASTKPTPAEIRKSITPDYLISFEDGKGYKTLRRHLTKVGLTPEAYRVKWGLGPDYPITSPRYSEQRSALARTLGLGKQQNAATAAKAAGRAA